MQNSTQMLLIAAEDNLVLGMEKSRCTDDAITLFLHSIADSLLVLARTAVTAYIAKEQEGNSNGS